MAKKDKKEVDNSSPAPSPEPTPEPVKGPSMDDLTRQENFPAVDQEAIEALEKMAATVNTEPAPTGTLTDSVGEKFDAALHRLGDDGKPSITKTGKFRKKTVSKLVRPQIQAANSSPQNSALPQVSSKQAAVIATKFFEQVSCKLISEEWKLSEMETAEAIQNWEGTFDYYGGLNLKPPHALAVTYLGFILTRIPKPETQSKFQLFKAWARNKWANRKVKNGARNNRGNDGERKNDMGKEESSQPTAN